jgi:GGDEF domain-containing protein
MKRFYHLLGAKQDSMLGISSENEFRRKLKIERSRAHRNGHVFSVVVFDLGALQLKKKNAGSIVDLINCNMHDYDHIGWYGRKKIGVILPYTSAEEAKEFSRNITDSFNHVRQEWKYTLISFPPKKDEMTPSEQLNKKPSRQVA